MNKQIWTIGHSTRSIESFIQILKAYDIKVLADVRSLPGSDKFPQFNQDNLMVSLNENGIEYRYIPLLGGLRPAKKDSLNDAWRNKSFRGYADYMETDDFKKGINILVTLAGQKNTVIMCSEILWWRCHRSMIADYLKSEGWTVCHIRDEYTSEIHPYTSPAKIVGHKLTYHQS